MHDERMSNEHMSNEDMSNEDMSNEDSPPILDPARRQVVLDRLQEGLDRAFGDLVRCVILKGSLFKGDFIPYFSDLDLHVFVDSEAMRGPLTPNLERALRFQEHFGSVDPEAYGVSQFQIYFVDASDFPDIWVPPLPGTYTIVAGALPELPEVTPDELYDRARAYILNFLPQAVAKSIESMVDKADRTLAPTVRLLGTAVKPAAYQAGILTGLDPVDVWRMPLAGLLAHLENATGLDGWGRYYAAVQPWREVREDGTRLRAAWLTGIQTLEAACRYFETHWDESA